MGMAPAVRGAEERPAGPPPGWWEAAFTRPPTPSEQQGHACGADEMLMVVGYDIANPRRLQRVARHCEDYGIRVQYSVFECRLPADEFQRFWDGLRALIDEEEDRVVAYRVCANCAREVLVAGVMTAPADHPVVAYVF